VYEWLSVVNAATVVCVVVCAVVLGGSSTECHQLQSVMLFSSLRYLALYYAV
jgi:hypothetical protein